MSNRNVSMVNQLMSASYAMRHCELPDNTYNILTIPVKCP